MDIKLIGIRNHATFVPAMAIRLSSTGDEAGDWLLREAGYDLEHPSIMLTRLTDGEGQQDPYTWTNRTMHTAHLWLMEHFDEAATGHVVAVEYILGERSTPKVKGVVKESVPIGCNSENRRGQHGILMALAYIPS
jgi:hypothetical protein